MIIHIRTVKAATWYHTTNFEIARYHLPTPSDRSMLSGFLSFSKHWEGKPVAAHATLLLFIAPRVIYSLGDLPSSVPRHPPPPRRSIVLRARCTRLMQYIGIFCSRQPNTGVHAMNVNIRNCRACTGWESPFYFGRSHRFASPSWGREIENDALFRNPAKSVAQW